MSKIKRGESKDADGNDVKEGIDNIQEHLEGLIAGQKAEFETLRVRVGQAQKVVQDAQPKLIALAAQLQGNLQLYEDVAGKPYEDTAEDAG